MAKLLKILHFMTLCILFTSSSIHGKEDLDTETTKEKKPPKIGNFALPSSQQPGALFGFGGNIIDEGEVQLNFFADEFIGKNKCVIDLIPSVLFGVTENFSIYFNFPTTPKFMDGKDKSAGFEDFYLQLEYALYSKTTENFADQATVLANITIPTGSIKKKPPTGYGSSSFFIGGTYYRTTVEWVFFTSQGAILTTSDHRKKIGDLFLYQFGIGRNIKSPEGWIYACTLELDGQFMKKNRFYGKEDPNSGGNAIYLTPGLWISSKEMISQFGVSFPVTQNLVGNQRKFDYALNFNFSWSFY